MNKLGSLAKRNEVLGPNVARQVKDRALRTIRPRWPTSVVPIECEMWERRYLARIGTVAEAFQGKWPGAMDDIVRAIVNRKLDLVNDPDPSGKEALVIANEASGIYHKLTY